MTNSQQVLDGQEVKDMVAKQNYRKPSSLMRPLRVQRSILMGAGPANCTERVLEALAQPLLGPTLDIAFQVLDEVKEGLQYLFQTRNELTLALTGSGNAGLEAAFFNLIEPRDTVLIAANGFWGERAGDVAFRQDAIVHVIRADYGSIFGVNDIKEALIKHRPNLMFITHGESSTGAFQPLETIGKLCREYDCLLVVDAVATLGAVSLLVDEWSIDCAYSASQKAIGSPPGLALITFSPRAVEKIESRKRPVSSLYFDVKLAGEFWNCFPGKSRKYHCTPSFNLLYALREGMSQIIEEGLDKRIAKHQNIARVLEEGLTKLEFEFFVSDASARLPTVTAIKATDGIALELLRSYCLDEYDMYIAPGLGPTAGICIRIGIMGSNANLDSVKLVLTALEKALPHSRKTNTTKRT